MPSPNIAWSDVKIMKLLKEQDKPDGDLYDGGQLGGGGEDAARDSILHQLRQRGEADRGHGEAAPEHVHHLGIIGN